MSSVTNAQSTCAQVSGQLAEVEKKKSDNAKWATFTDPFSLIRNKTDSQIMNTNVNYLDLSSSDIQNINNSCSNVAVGNQQNVVNQDSSCLTAALSVCKKKDGTYDMDCVTKQQSAVTITNVNQSNLNKIQEQCFINNLIKKVSTKDANIDNVTAVLASQKAAGFGSQVNSLTSNCNEVRTDMSSKDFLNSIMNCANEVSSNQSNVFSACGGTNINQQNVGEYLSKCYADSKIYQEKNVSMAVKAETSIKAVQVSDTFGSIPGFDSSNPSSSACLIIVILLCCSLSGYVAMQNM